MHAYVRFKLNQKYGDSKVSKTGPIPSHLFGNLWAQTWSNLENLLLPFPDQPEINITPTMQKSNLTAYDIFKISEEFFTSLGLPKMTDKFWEKSVITKPEGIEMVCHASAWDFSSTPDRDDFRIKQCTTIDQKYFVTTHHEMGHIAYYQQYKNLEYVFKTGANPGFHEALGDTLSLSVATPKHLNQVGLLENSSNSYEADINFLLKMALGKVAFLPFGYLIDDFRWKIYNNQTSPENFQKSWDQLRLEYQGIIPPVFRTFENFDALGKYHVTADVAYIRYFTSHIYQFQFYEGMCEAAGHTGPLYKCDFYNSLEAGKVMSEALKLGASKPWPEVLKIFTNGKSDKIDTSSLIRYFSPLMDWLDQFITENEVPIDGVCHIFRLMSLNFIGHKF